MAQTITIADFVKAANKKYGAGSVVRLNDKPRYKYGENVIPTGSITLNAALGVGGYPQGRIIEILGNASSGKTTMALHAIAEAHKMGLDTLYIDAEHTIDTLYAEAIGVDVDKLYVMQPDYGEQALNIAEEAINTKVFGLVVVDSVAALVPKRELDGEMGDAQVGLLARMMSQACRKLSGVLARTNTTMIFINQFRATISTGGFGGPSKLPTGGKALEYYSSIILEVAKIQSLKSGDEQTGNKTQVTVKKNKVAPPYKVAEFDIAFGVGIDKYGEIVDVAEEFGLVKKSGSWYKLDNGESLQGKASVINYLKENVEYGKELTSKIGLEISGRLSGEDTAEISECESDGPGENDGMD